MEERGSLGLWVSGALACVNMSSVKCCGLGPWKGGLGPVKVSVFLWLEGISLTVSMVGVVPLQLFKLVLLSLAASMTSSSCLVLPVANFNEHMMWQVVKSPDLVHLEAICLHSCVQGKGDL